MDYYSIPPFAHLRRDAECQHYLTVAQWVEQEEALFNFYKERTLAGASLILDNGQHEFREVYPIDKYLDMAKELGATMVVAPDVWKNAMKTRDEIFNFMDSMSENELCDFKVMGVPHGKTIEEYRWCYGEVCAEVDIVGLAKDEWADSTGHIRPFFTWHLEGEKVPIKFHLLGLTHVGELLHCNPYKVASFDTALPYKLGRVHEYVHDTTVYGEKYDPKLELEDFQLKVSIENCKILRELADGIKTNLWRCNEDE